MDFKRFWLAILIVFSLAVPSYSADIRTGGGHVVQDEGSDKPQQPRLNFIGGGVQCVDGSSKTDCTITGAAMAPEPNYYVAGHTSPAEMWNFDATEGGLTGGGVVKGALRFDGVDDWVSVADQAGFDDNELSIAFWIYSPSNTTSVVLSHTSSTSGSAGYRVQANAGTSGPIIQFVSNGAFTTSNTVEMTLNTWYFVVITASSTTGRDIYYNNASVYTDEGNYTAAAADCVFRIGVRTTSSCSTFVTPYLVATLDDLRIYKTTLLTTGEMATLYNSGYGLACSGGAQTNLVSCWGFDEISGTTATDVKSSYNGTLTNFPVTAYQTTSTTTGSSGWATNHWQASSKCKYNGCTYFDGIDSYAEVRNISDVVPVLNVTGTETKFTVEAWVFTESYSTQQGIVEIGNNVNHGYALRLAATTGYLQGYVTDSATVYSCAGTAAIGLYAWKHVAMTFDSSVNELKCYVNGAQVGTTTSVTYNPAIATTDTLNIGSRSDNIYPFIGKIDEVAIWGVALPATGTGGIDIDERYVAASELVGNETGLEAVWHFNDGVGMIATQIIPQSGVGDDANSCTVYTAPCKTVQAAVNKIPKFYAGATTLHVASGIYLEDATMRGFNPSGDYTVAINGHINPIPNNFNSVVSGVPTDVASITSTATATATANFPKDTRSLFTDTATTFTTDADEQILKITSGTGWEDDSSGYDYKNWYRIECGWGTSCTAGTKNNLSVVTAWLINTGDGTGTAPASGTGYKVFYEKYMPVIHGGGANRWLPNSAHDGVRDRNLSIQDSAGISIRKMKFSGAKSYAVHINSSSLDEVSTSTFDYSNYAGLWLESSFVTDVIANKYAKNRNEGFILFQNSAAMVIGKNFSVNNNGPGFASYFSSSVLVMNVYLLKNNTQNNMDWEANSQCILANWIRSDQTVSGNYGIVINSAATFTILGNMTIVGNVAATTGVYIGSSSKFEGYGFTTGTNVEIKTSLVGIRVSMTGVCDSILTTGCAGYTFTGNTTNITSGIARSYITDTVISAFPDANVAGPNNVALYLSEADNLSTGSYILPYINNIRVYEVAYDGVEVNAYVPTTYSITVTGVTTSDVVLSVNKPYDARLIATSAYVSATNTIDVSIANTTGLAYNPGSQTYQFFVATKTTATTANDCTLMGKDSGGTSKVIQHINIDGGCP